MQKKQFHKKVKKLKFVAHRLGFQMTEYPENSLYVLEEIFENKEMLDSCSGFEFDICFTKDHIPVVIHDKYIDDISDNIGLVKSYSINQLQKMNFGLRKSLNNGNNNFKFKIITLEEILKFFSFKHELLKDKIIKIETKDIVKFNTQNIKVLADIINQFPELSDNIIHLSFYPLNLIALKKIQKKNHFNSTKSDLLCDFRIVIMLSKILKNIDCISLRIKTKDFPKPQKQNSIRVNRKIFLDTLFMNLCNCINENTLQYAIKKYGSVNLYVLNSNDDIEEFCKKISNEFFEKNYEKFFFTTDNPYYLKNEI